jgi:hypothetical protein
MALLAFLQLEESRRVDLYIDDTFSGCKHVKTHIIIILQSTDGVMVH